MVRFVAAFYTSSGIIEVISIAIRPVSLSFRLFGNIYAGETLLHTMQSVGASLPPPINWISLILFPLPFYFLELLAGLLQSFRFRNALRCLYQALDRT